MVLNYSYQVLINMKKRKPKKYNTDETNDTY